MVKRVLMIAFHYPPMRGGSGIQRTLAFSRDLPQWGWEPLILSVHPRAHENLAGPGDGDATGGVQVHRSYALDAGRDLAIRGRYPALLAQPDRWISWWLSAVPAGLRLIRRHRPDLIWSSYPIATAHLIALSLHRLTGLPWIADQRDPMIDHDYPADPRRRRIHRWIEAKAVQRCAALVCTTPGALRAMRQRFHGTESGRFALIENGYDEASFADAERLPAATRPNGADAVFRMVHSGVIYPSERDPRPLFAALGHLLARGVLGPGNFRLVLRATGHDGYLQGLVGHYGLGALVELAPPLPYRAALAEMLGADGLLLLQAANCNDQIPAKFYEYLRAGRPVLALTDPAGETAAALRRAGVGTICALDCPHAIAAALADFLRLCLSAAAPLASAATIARHARTARAGELAALFNRLPRQEQP